MMAVGQYTGRAGKSIYFDANMGPPCRQVHYTDDVGALTLHGHIKTAEQRAIQQYGDWYTHTGR